MEETSTRELLERLQPLVGTWRVSAAPAGGEPWPGEGQVTIQWHDCGAFLIERSRARVQDAPDGVAIMGCDAANGTYRRLHYDDRGICRIYEMSINDSQWRLRRDGAPFPQRFSATIAEDGSTLTGRWEKARDGHTWETDFELTYRRAAEPTALDAPRSGSNPDGRTPKIG